MPPTSKPDLQGTFHMVATDLAHTANEHLQLEADNRDIPAKATEELVQ